MSSGNGLVLSLEGYRGFKSGCRVDLPIIDGTVVILGPNNSGKSTLLRAVWELRRTLTWCLSDLTNNIVFVARGNRPTPAWPVGWERDEILRPDLNEAARVSIRLLGDWVPKLARLAPAKPPPRRNL
jgi:hypothetical protein